jgi:hypothetical protein
MSCPCDKKQISTIGWIIIIYAIVHYSFMITTFWLLLTFGNILVGVGEHLYFIHKDDK